MKKMSKMESIIAKIALIVVAVIIVGIVLGVFVYKPSSEQMEKKNTELAALAAQVEEAKKAPALIISYKEKINALIGGSEENSNLLSKVIDVPDILKLIENGGEVSGLDFTEISMNGNAAFVKGGIIETEEGEQTEIVVTETFYLLEVKLKVVTNYTQLWRFLQFCENAGYYLTVDNISVSESEGSNGSFQGDVQLNFYSIVSGSDAASAASAQQEALNDTDSE